MNIINIICLLVPTLIFGLISIGIDWVGKKEAKRYIRDKLVNNKVK